MTTEHVDVLIVGAGLSGIGAGYHLQARCPGKSYAILEARDAIGGTWDLFRYPGIRSDSDMYTLGYDFRPWEQAKAIADGPSILEYVRATAREAGIDQHVRFGHRVVRAAWDSTEDRWRVEAQRTDTGETVQLTCGWLFACSGYYRYDKGYTPDFPGVERFGGTLIHPQHWPEDLDCAGKRVLVVGSGATAMTIVPALTGTAEHVTMLQRSPTYVISLPAEDPIANGLRRVLPSKVAYAITRWKNVLVTMAFFELSRRRPGLVRRLVRKHLERLLPDGYAIDPHFTPSYDPWDQRVCLIPDSDLFEAIGAGHADVVTDTIETFTETGVRLTSGAELTADIVVTATGLELLLLGGIELSVDGTVVDPAERVAYKGMMLSGVPNLSMTFGYTNASWTLKADLTCAYVCRLLQHLDATGATHATPRPRDPAMPTMPFLDLTSGYVQRSVHLFPKQGLQAPWRLYQNYARDILMLKRGAVVDDAIEFGTATPARERPEPVAA